MNLNFCFKLFMWLHKAEWSKSQSSTPFQVWWNRPCRREDIKFSIWHVISCDDVMRLVQLHFGLYLAICRHPEKFSCHKSFGRRNIPFLVFIVFHVTSSNQVVRRTCDLMGEFTSPYIINWPRIRSFELVTWAHVIKRLECHLTLCVNLSYY